MNDKKFSSKQKENDLQFIEHILFEIGEYAGSNSYDPISMIIDIAEFLLWLCGKECKDERKKD